MGQTLPLPFGAPKIMAQQQHGNYTPSSQMTKQQMIAVLVANPPSGVLPPGATAQALKGMLQQATKQQLVQMMRAPAAVAPKGPAVKKQSGQKRQKVSVSWQTLKQASSVPSTKASKKKMRAKAATISKALKRKARPLPVLMVGTTEIKSWQNVPQQVGTNDERKAVFNQLYKAATRLMKRAQFTPSSYKPKTKQGALIQQQAGLSAAQMKRAISLINAIDNGWIDVQVITRTTAKGVTRQVKLKHPKAYKGGSMTANWRKFLARYKGIKKVPTRAAAKLDKPLSKRDQTRVDKLKAALRGSNPKITVQKLQRNGKQVAIKSPAAFASYRSDPNKAARQFIAKYTDKQGKNIRIPGTSKTKTPGPTKAMKSRARKIMRAVRNGWIPAKQGKERPSDYSTGTTREKYKKFNTLYKGAKLAAPILTFKKMYDIITTGGGRAKPYFLEKGTKYTVTTGGGRKGPGAVRVISGTGAKPWARLTAQQKSQVVQSINMNPEFNDTGNQKVTVAALDQAIRQQKQVVKKRNAAKRPAARKAAKKRTAKFNREVSAALRQQKKATKQAQAAAKQAQKAAKQAQKAQRQAQTAQRQAKGAANRHFTSWR